MVCGKQFTVLRSNVHGFAIAKFRSYFNGYSFSPPPLTSSDSCAANAIGPGVKNVSSPLKFSMSLSRSITDACRFNESYYGFRVLFLGVSAWRSSTVIARHTSGLHCAAMTACESL